MKKNLSSISELTAKFLRAFLGPTFLMTFLRTDRLFREKVLLTVSMSNECGG